ncbi:MAG: hypothetical protein GOVbin1782_24 [Prokaryotic dsDNA virus sp.]|nr:MAG: hypothetical protein GOVbin1782_24 [Prokaryotic dsDNA virus sp.]|tara:strand:+ start:12503 stop:13039 length:537 start_codon:yes stop_codon:yes gene_type:complete
MDTNQLVEDYLKNTPHYTNSEDIVVLTDWKERIEWSFDHPKKASGLLSIFQEKRGVFLETIWQMSMTAFDKPREVQVVIDNNDKLFISFGTFSFVEFMEDPVGMKLPIKCWIHTHPFGSAYFSGTDMKTINTWKPIMISAIVLGDGEHQTWMNTSSNKATHYTYAKKRLVELNGGEEE